MTLDDAKKKAIEDALRASGIDGYFCVNEHSITVRADIDPLKFSAAYEASLAAASPQHQSEHNQD